MCRDESYSRRGKKKLICFKENIPSSCLSGIKSICFFIYSRGWFRRRSHHWEESLIVWWLQEFRQSLYSVLMDMCKQMEIDCHSGDVGRSTEIHFSMGNFLFCLMGDMSYTLHHHEVVGKHLSIVQR
uniref:Uncharacterized protein n=1 Tax=Zea mays TaxID=4577 RepID=A0A804M2S6_MAIZE